MSEAGDVGVSATTAAHQRLSSDTAAGYVYEYPYGIAEGWHTPADAVGAFLAVNPKGHLEPVVGAPLSEAARFPPRKGHPLSIAAGLQAADAAGLFSCPQRRGACAWGGHARRVGRHKPYFRIAASELCSG